MDRQIPYAGKGREGKAIYMHFLDYRDIAYIMSHVKKLKGTGNIVHRGYVRLVWDNYAYLMMERTEVELFVEEVICR